MLSARSLPTDINRIRTHAGDDETPLRRATYESLPYDPLEHIDDVPRDDTINSDQSSVGSAVKRYGEQITAKKPTSNPTDKFSTIITEMTLQSAD